MFTNSLTLIQLLELAKSVDYTFPEKNLEEWTTEEIFYGSIYVTLSNSIQLKATILLCEMFSPIKIFFKTTLKNYIKEFSKNKINH